MRACQGGGQKVLAPSALGVNLFHHAFAGNASVHTHTLTHSQRNETFPSTHYQLLDSLSSVSRHFTVSLSCHKGTTFQLDPITHRVPRRNLPTASDLLPIFTADHNGLQETDAQAGAEQKER